MKLKSNRLYMYFTWLILIVNIIAIIVIAVLGSILLHYNIINPQIFTSPWVLLVFILICFFTGTTISLIVARIILQPISDLNTAMKSVIDSGFTIKLDENQSLDEIGELYRSFNVLTHELGHIETIQNDFISNISHEFKTPLATIQGYVQLLQADNLTEEERQLFYKNIIQASQQLTSLSDNILKIAKLENSSIGIEKNRFRVDEQLRQAILFLQPAWEAKHLQLTIDLDSININANEELIYQVWTNLLSNAIKYNQDGGEVSVRLSTKSDNELVCTVRDTGMGIPEKDQPFIFEKFYQGDTSRKVAGTGLGLSIIKRIVEAHHGTIDFISQEGVGSEFTVYLPIQ